ncbi:hypothetical protein STEG23_031274 [Scotinomys teguina]
MCGPVTVTGSEGPGLLGNPQVEADVSSSGPYGEPSLLWSPELSAVRAAPVRSPGPAGSRVGARCLVRRIPEDRKAEDVASMDDVGSAEPAVVDDIGPAVPPNGDHARTSILGPVESVALSFAYFNSVWGAPVPFYY